MFLREVAKKTASVIGVDVNAEMIESQKDSRMRVMSGTELDFKDSTFDTVYSFEVIEHIPNIHAYFKEVSRVLKPSGKLVVSFPFELIRGTNAIGDAMRSYGNPLLCRKLHVHKLTPEKISTLIKDTALRIQSSRLLLAPFPTFLVVLTKN